MSTKSVAIIGLLAVAFGVFFLFVVVKMGTNRNARPPGPIVALKAFDGKLGIQSIDDLRVAGRKILLCGAAFTKPPSLRAMVTEAAKRDYQGLAVHCKPVGTGTPCDGNVASKFGDTAIVQCFTPEGTDLAAKLTQDGLLCGQPAQAGATYKPC